MTSTTDSASRSGAAAGALFLPSTPLHSFWSIGLAAGPFAGSRNVLALIDQRPGEVDYIVEAARAIGFESIAEFHRFGRIGKRPIDKLRGARRVMEQVRALSARIEPAVVVAGNDRRAEFYAALHDLGAGVGAYVDDGLFSYVPMPLPSRGAWLTWLSERARRLIYGVDAEQPRHVGGSDAVRDAWVMLPYQVHEGLAGKHVQRLEPAWFRSPPARAVYARAMEMAGVDATHIGTLRMLLLLPHDAFLRAHPELFEALKGTVRRHLDAGHAVAVKRHPRSNGTPLPRELAGCAEIPHRIPVEILAPFLEDVDVVGSLTTAMISLVKLGANVRARSLAPVATPAHRRMNEVYLAAGVGPLESPKLDYVL
ncbi:hypothetical protein DFR24_1192 [Panacagrimonas perspica]|uniref:Glycosyl transferase family 52 n=1 Tax=Panacagrimonas perspica TaxID=381431 RepID=A0A4S3K4H9_9GAMM|nr:hypothetical protein [Panacagrimonas perspica]TDU31810.1 hypothetical protein DFR24_1192 [Panacagrimonas perspica]THD02982.1 hypothetical protein B1810_10285 [Panacagrimonas perspica]